MEGKPDPRARPALVALLVLSPLVLFGVHWALPRESQICLLSLPQQLLLCSNLQLVGILTESLPACLPASRCCCQAFQKGRIAQPSMLNSARHGSEARRLVHHACRSARLARTAPTAAWL